MAVGVFQDVAIGCTNGSCCISVYPNLSYLFAGQMRPQNGAGNMDTSKRRSLSPGCPSNSRILPVKSGPLPVMGSCLHSVS